MTTTFFTAANHAYEPFIAPYALSVLSYNPNATIEICVENVARCLEAHGAAIAVAQKHFPDQLLVRQGRFDTIRAGSVRFLEEPTAMTEYTYIGDIDIIILEEVAEQHLASMTQSGLPYSNMLRPSSPDRPPRLTGLHFTRSADHYPLVDWHDWVLPRNDEELLYRVVQAKGLPLPPPGLGFRPVHGLHLSLKRSPTRGPGLGPPWQAHPSYITPYLALRDSLAWQETEPHFHPTYRALLLLLEAILQASDDTRPIFRPSTLRTLWLDLLAHPRP